MTQEFCGWVVVADRLREEADRQQSLADKAGAGDVRLNTGQRASLCAIADRIPKNGVVIADEVGMGKTRIAVELARAVVQCGGRVAILIPPGLGYQWQAELRDGDVDAPPVLRSLWAYLSAWNPDVKDQRPWFGHGVVTISHSFTDWRLGANAANWRWTLLPELYARWRSRTEGRLPRGYNEFAEQHSDTWVSNAADEIVGEVLRTAKYPARRMLDELLRDIQWPAPLNSAEYGNGSALRGWLERGVGLGLGFFDLVIIDEAHKRRGYESGLSRLLNNVVLQSGLSRKFAMTATPVELDISQWRSTLGRIGVTEAVGEKFDESEIGNAIRNYSDAVHRLQQCWRSSNDSRVAYTRAAERFQKYLSPYLLRRDKREDTAVQEFGRRSGLGIHSYRREQEIAVEPAELPPAWRQAVCAAEAYSIASAYADDPTAKRLRLTMGSGYGLADVLDRLAHKCDDDDKQIDASEAEIKIESREIGIGASEVRTEAVRTKRQQRADWWLSVLKSCFRSDEDLLFDHPAILSTVRAIESETGRGEKVLVFGRFTRPLRALVQLLNAREMLRRIEIQQPWPQAKVHGEGGDSEWPALRAAHRQIGSSVDLAKLDDLLRSGYQAQRRRRERLRDQLLTQIETGLGAAGKKNQRVEGLFSAFRSSVVLDRSGVDDERNPLAIVSRALAELVGEKFESAGPSEYAEAFSRLIEAATDRDDSENSENFTEEDAAELWSNIEIRLHEEFNRPQGTFARLMFGETKIESRRMIQLAFNRPNSFPRVLVAQSMVGREGLNLHHACRIVVLLHPEWNPGVVEQQIGRVDRVGSHWSKSLNECPESTASDDLPRIEIRPVIFRGTYDEHNWAVLRERWDDLRAQLHGVVVPERLAASEDREGVEMIADIAKHAPRFSPQNREHADSNE